MFDQRVLERFEQFVYPDPNSGCFLWGGAEVTNGYGKFSLWKPRKHYLAHRFAWLAAGRDLPESLVLRHKCDTRLCVNPDHLVLGTVADNAIDMALRGRGTKGSLPYGVHLSYRPGKRYRVQIQIGKPVHLGSFGDLQEAAAAALKGKEDALRALGRLPEGVS